MTHNLKQDNRFPNRGSNTTPAKSKSEDLMLCQFFLLNKIKYRHVLTHFGGLFQEVSKTQELGKNWQFKQIIVRWLIN